MDPMKQQIRLKLIANMIEERCAHQPNVIFKASLCTQERCIRFSTSLLEELFPPAENMGGAWKCGKHLMYEIINEADRFQITLSVSNTGFDPHQKKERSQLLSACKVNEDRRDRTLLRMWNHNEVACDTQGTLRVIEDFFEYELPYFETELRAWKKDHAKFIKPFPVLEEDTEPISLLPADVLIEGAEKATLINRYERNRNARKKCIAIHGTACNICGFDFGDTYGPAFSGKIEVHHLIPLHLIREDYVVDPQKDLIPVCPNCHLMLHSKPAEEPYTPDELHRMMKR